MIYFSNRIDPEVEKLPEQISILNLGAASAGLLEPYRGVRDIETLINLEENLKTPEEQFLTADAEEIDELCKLITQVGEELHNLKMNNP